MFVPKADELKGITAIEEIFLPAPRQRGGARGSGTRPNSVGAGGSGRGQATSSVAHTSSPTVAAPTPNESAGDLLTAVVDAAGSVVDSAAQLMIGAVSSGLSLLAVQDKGDEPARRWVYVSPVLSSSDSDSDSLGGDDQEDEDVVTDVGGQAARIDTTTSERTSKRLRR